MKQIILGTAGHIDHGKTSLIKTLTGINTDRLKEEKLRGITIELGFASMTLPSGQHVGIVDVPGHEKFVKNMVAGAAGIDIVAMIIAADEGIMPQTKEHMEICALLDIKHGIVVLTKTDLVDQEWMELINDDVKEFMQGTFMQNAPVLQVSSVNRQGIPEFIKVLDELSATIPVRPRGSLFRLPVDRVFSMKGFGTVVTGTLISGQVKCGDSVMIYPSCVAAKVRGIQVHNESVDIAEAGMRTAINFQGLEKTLINRGDVISTPKALTPSYMIDVSIQFLNSNKKPLKNRSLIRFHTGTSELFGNLILLDREELMPDEVTEAQIRLDSPAVVVKDDRFVIRSYSPMRTIGGGRILNPIPKKHKRFKQEILNGLKSLAECPSEEIIIHHVNQSDYKGVAFSDLKIMTNMSEKQLNNAINAVLSKKDIIQIDKEKRIYIHKNNFEKLKKQICDYLDKHHANNPLRKGISKEELKSKFPFLSVSNLFNLALNQLINNEKTVSQNENIIHLVKHTVCLGTDQSNASKKILNAYLESGLKPPYFKELCKILDINAASVKDVLMLLVNQKKLVKMKQDLYFHAEVVDNLKNELIDFLSVNKEITTPQFKDMTKVSRKYAIPLIEYFDSKGVTIRVGDIRRLRQGQSSQ